MRGELYLFFQKNKIVNTQFEFTLPELWILVKKITPKQRKLIYTLKLLGKHRKFIDVLHNIGFKYKKTKIL